MKLPTRLAVALGTLVAGLVALSGEVAIPHSLHQAIVIVGAFALFLVHPQEAGVVKVTVPESSRTPDGSLPAQAPPQAGI